MRVASLIEQVQAIQDRRSALYQSYEDAVNKYKSSKDTTSFVANRKKIDADHKQLSQQISALQNKLKTEGSDVADKVCIGDYHFSFYVRVLMSFSSNFHTLYYLINIIEFTLGGPAAETRQ